MISRLRAEALSTFVILLSPLPEQSSLDEGRDRIFDAMLM